MIFAEFAIKSVIVFFLCFKDEKTNIMSGHFLFFPLFKVRSITFYVVGQQSTKANEFVEEFNCTPKSWRGPKQILFRFT